MNKLLVALLLPLILYAFIPNALAAKSAKLQQAQKDRLVLMPLHLPEEDRNLAGAMESALVKGLQQKYEVFSGDQVSQKARQIFNKESKSAKKECDETRCMQGIAEAFQAELIATANITKQDGGYFLALSIQNIFDNKVVYSESLTCRGCDSFQVVDKLKELAGAPASAGVPTEVEAPVSSLGGNPDSPENSLWVEVQKGNSIDDYQAYLGQYPKGKFMALAKSRIKKIQEQDALALAGKDQAAWDGANSVASEAGYQGYLNSFPQGQYAALAQARINKIKREDAEKEQAARQKVETERQLRLSQASSQSASITTTVAGEMPALAKKANCTACHTINRSVVGPAWRDVAAKYRGVSDAEARLIEKVSRGGSGVWGSLPMPANAPRVSQEDIRALVKFILALP
ncbi:MAG TPA: c-type cytochrome [Sideroxyarcus sp.]|nr:c-type cytochrome [Sideroxyarcus sp.]